MGDGDAGSTGGNDDSGDRATREKDAARRDGERLREDLERFGAPPPRIHPGAPLATPPVNLNRRGPEGDPATARRSEFTEVESDDQNGGRSLKVLDGGPYSDVEDQAAPGLSPPAAASLGDLATAMLGPLAGGLAARSTGVFIVAALIVLIARAHGRRCGLTEREITGVSPVAGSLAVLAMTLVLRFDAGLLHALKATGLCFAAGASAALLLNFLYDRFVHTRIALIGSAADAHDLAWSLAEHGNTRFSVVGYVTRDGAKENLRELRHVSFKVRRLGLLADLSHIVARHDVDLLVLAEGRHRLEVFERAAVCTERYRTRLVGLLAFEEAAFQRVAIDQLNIAWMQHLMHPLFRPTPRIATRTLDVVGALFLALLTAPAWLISAAAVKLADRGPLLERRRSVGERGRSFSVLKFRTTPPPGKEDLPDTEGLPPTTVGRVLRILHWDALPLLLNVLRGDMSLVGPRPARPRDVTRLEQDVPFYGRRHLIKPGITGWAQLRSGHDADDSETEAATLTLSRDLFYLKHQSLFLYGFVLFASLWAALAGTLQLRDR